MVFAVAASLVLLACGQSTGELAVTASEDDVVTSVPTTMITSTLSELGEPEVPGIGSSYRPPDGWAVRRQLPVETAMLARDGLTVEIAFVGGPEGEPEGLCVRNYEFVHQENQDSVEVALFELGASDRGELTGNESCTAVGYGWRLAIAFARPLDERVFIDDLTSDPAPLVDLSEVLLPTISLDGFTEGDPWISQSGWGELTTGFEADSGDGFVSVSSAPVSDEWNLDWVRQRDLVIIEDEEIRYTPGLEVSSLEDGATTLAWEENGRMYLVHGYLVEPTVLKRMASTMA
ncbi:MAG: hypothetical protein AAF962_27955 [Actinomycetota bacterium]